MPPSPTFRAFVASERDRVAAELAGRAGGEASSAAAKKKALMIELARLEADHVPLPSLAPRNAPGVCVATNLKCLVGLGLLSQWKARYPEAAKASAAAAAKPVNPATVSTTSPTTAPAARPSWHPPVNSLRTSLLGTGAGETPVAMRMRAIYYLRSIGGALKTPFPLCDPLQISALARTRIFVRVSYRLSTDLASTGPDELAVLCAALPLDATSPVPHSPLLRHEVAYVLGQLRDPVACDVLEVCYIDCCAN